MPPSINQRPLPGLAARSLGADGLVTGSSKEGRNDLEARQETARETRTIPDCGAVTSWIKGLDFANLDGAPLIGEMRLAHPPGASSCAQKLAEANGGRVAEWPNRKVCYGHSAGPGVGLAPARASASSQRPSR